MVIWVNMYISHTKGTNTQTVLLACSPLFSRDKYVYMWTWWTTSLKPEEYWKVFSMSPGPCCFNVNGTEGCLQCQCEGGAVCDSLTGECPGGMCDTASGDLAAFGHYSWQGPACQTGNNFLYYITPGMGQFVRQVITSYITLLLARTSLSDR